MNSIFGANWWTTLWGFVTVAAGAIAINPDIIGFLPASWQPTTKGIALFITVVAGGTFAVGVKSKNVTGGTVQQTVSGAPAASGTQTLVDQTVKSSIASGETVTPEQKAAVQV